MYEGERERETKARRIRIVIRIREKTVVWKETQVKVLSSVE